MKKHPIPIVHYISGFIAIVGLWGAFLVPSVYADTIYSQLVDSSKTNSSISGAAYVQSLGNGLTGSLDGFQVEYSNTEATTTSQSLIAGFYRCNSQPTTGLGGCTELFITTDSALSQVAGTHLFTANFDIDFDPTKYYAILLQTYSNKLNGILNLQIAGSSSNSWTNGQCNNYNSVPGTSCSPVVDVFFILSGTQTTQSSSLAYNLKPETASTTSSTYVNFTFKYDALASHSITTYKLYLKDSNTPSPILYDSVVTGTAGTGTGVSVSRYLTLTSGHAYTWWVDLCSATQCYSSNNSQTFSVVTPFYLNPVFSPISATSTLLSGGTGINTSTLSGVSELQCGALDILDGTCFTSILSYLFIPNAAIIAQFTSLSSLLATKIPFSYVYSIEEAANNIELTTSSSSFPLISIPLSTVASSTVTGVIPDIELSTSTISTYLTPTFHNALYALLIAAIWLNVGWLFFREAMRIFKS